MRRTTTAAAREAPINVLAAAHLAAGDAVKLLHLKIRTLLNSPKHDPVTLNSYLAALEKLVGIGRETTGDSHGGAPRGDQPVTPPSGGARGVLVVPGLLADSAEWERQMGLYEATRERG